MGKTITVTGICIGALLMELGLWNMWEADKSYAMGKNLNGVQSYVSAYPYLSAAVETNPNEPTYHDELAYNQAVLAALLFSQINSSTASAIASLSAVEKLSLKSPQLDASVNDLMTAALDNSNKAVETSPSSLTFWKSRTKMFYQLAAIDQKYYLQALESLKAAVDLAPTDAKVIYNYALLTGRLGNLPEAIKMLEMTMELKPDYTDAQKTLEEFKKNLTEKND